MKYNLTYETKMTVSVDAIIEEFVKYLKDEIGEIAPFEEVTDVDFDEDGYITVKGKMSGYGEETIYYDRSMPNEFDDNWDGDDVKKEMKKNLEGKKEFTPRFILKNFIDPDKVWIDKEITDYDIDYGPY